MKFKPENHLDLRHPTRLLVLVSLANAPLLAHGAPVGDNSNIVSGTGNISSAGSITTINQSSQNLAIDWDSFNINSGETVNFVQPNSSAIALNRDFSGSPSQIYGNLNANGHVFLLNTAGVLMSPSASVNVGSLLITDMAISDSAAQQFGSGMNAGTLAFSDADLQAGGITIMGSIVTNGVNGANFLGQYIQVGGDVSTINGDLSFKVGGSAVLVTDPGGMYGIELADPVTNDISVNGELYGYIDTPLTLNVVNGNIVQHVKYQTDMGPTTPLANEPESGNVTITVISGQVLQTEQAVAPPLVLTPTEETETDATITDSLSDEPPETSPTAGDTISKTPSSLDGIMDDCVPQDPSDRDCIKQNAIKRYLGKLLIGGSLPD